MWIARFMLCNCGKPNCNCQKKLQKPPTHVSDEVTSDKAAEQLGWLDGEWKELTEEELKELQKPSLSERVKEAIGAIHTRLDTFAQTRDYKNMDTLISYANDSNPVYKLEGNYGKTIRSITESTGFDILNKVESGILPETTLDSFESMLPIPKWPNKKGTTLPNV